MSTTATKAKAKAAHGAARTLQLANPHLSGDDVKQAQQLLSAGTFGNFNPGSIDGEFGPATATAIKQAKWMLGYPTKACNDVFGPQLAGFLQGKPLPAVFKLRRNRRLKQAAGQAGVRSKIVELARWGIQNELSIHYQQRWAGSKVDPNGGNFTGAYTGTMLQHCRHIPKSAVQPGDLVVWGAYPGHHVALVLQAGSDPLLCSHGQEKGPIAISFSAESKYQPSPATWLACLP